MPVIELTTVGRKSGEKRSTMLTSPLTVGESYVVVASHGGSEHHPAWYLNLKANPRVEIVRNAGTPETRTARIADAPLRASLWSQITDQHKNYAGYQEKTSREIPLVLLDPVR
jgi:deazaflavin-dependent oxidoreductase (nitroreductase family)